MTIGVSTGEQFEDEFQYYIQSMQTEEGLPFFQLQEPGLDREGGLDQLKRKREQQDDFDAGVMRTLRPGKEVPDALPGMIINPKDMELMKSLGKEASLNEPGIMSDAPSITAARERFDWLHYTTSVRPPYRHMTPEERDMTVPIHNYDIKKVGPTDPSISIMNMHQGKQAWGHPGPEDGDEDVRIDLATVNPMDPFEAAAEKTRTKHPTRFYDFQKKGHLSNANWEFVGKYLLHKLGETVESAKNAFQAPYKAYKGELDPNSPEAIKAMFDLASTMVFAPMPIASKMADGTLGSFAGVKAAKADQLSLRQARKMNAEGKSKEDIYGHTGWWLGSDGNWRFELRSQDMKLRVPLTQLPNHAKLKDIIDYPDLFDHYPQFNKTEVSLDKHLTASAEFDPSLNLFTINPDRIENKKGLLNSFIHEIQHQIQQIEGWPGKGTSPEVSVIRAEHALLDRAEAALAKNDIEGAQKIMDYIKRVLKDPDKLDEVSLQLYMRDAGEIEARIAEARREWDTFGKQEHPMNTLERAKQLNKENFYYNQFNIPRSPRLEAMVSPQKIKFDRFDTYERKGVQHYGLEFNKTYKLENIVDNKELFKKYPELRKIKVVRAADEGMYHFDVEKNTLHIGVMDSDTLYQALDDVVKQKTQVNPQQSDSTHGLKITENTDFKQPYAWTSLDEPSKNIKERLRERYEDWRYRLSSSSEEAAFPDYKNAKFYRFETKGIKGEIDIVPIDKGKGVYVGWIGASKKEGDLSIVAEPWSLGPELLVELLKQVKKAFPKAEYIEGHRVSGARGLQGAPQTIRRKIPKNIMEY